MNYSPEDIKQGVQIQRQAKETPSSFGLLDGADQYQGSDSFGQTRMAGQVGARVLDLINNQDESNRTNAWMQQFGQSVQGAEFNQVKMGTMAPPEEQK